MDLALDKLLSKVNLDGFGKLPTNARLAIGPIVMVVIFGLYWSFGYAPAQEEIVQLQSQQRETQRKLAEVKAIAGNLPAFQQEVEELEDRLAQALKQLPVSSELPALLTDISSLGMQSGLDISLFEPLKERAHSFYSEVPIALEFDGGYHSAAIFFAKLANLPRIVNVNGLSMKVKKGTKEGTTLRVEGTITTFRFLEGGEA